MIYNEIKLIIDELVEDNKFVYYDFGSANIEGDDVEKGQYYIILDSPTRTIGTMRGVGTFGEILNVRLLILKNYTDLLGGHDTELDDNSIQINAIQSECYLLAKKIITIFINKFPYADRSQGSLQKISFNFESIQYLFNANFHGVMMDLRLPVNLPNDYCLV